MKKLLSLMLAVVTVLLLCVSATAYGEELVILSELSDGELLAFISESGVDIPSAYNQEEECVEFVRYIVEHIEKNGSVCVTFGYSFLEDFAEDIESAVLDYYGDYLVTPYVRQDSQSNILQDNVVVGTWNPDYDSTNCYAYALGYPERAEPGQIKSGTTGDGPYTGEMFYGLEELFLLVKDDLEFLGYVSVGRLYSSHSNYQVTKHKRLICLRMRTNSAHDFHFMVKQEDQLWYQKPNARNPMRYIKEMSDDVPWVYEAYHQGEDQIDHYVRDTEFTYSGTIIYIQYEIPCTNMHYVVNGDNTHSKICTECGKNNATMSCTYAYEYCGISDGSGTHIQTCTFCGGTRGTPATCVYTNGECRFCGSIQPNIKQRIIPEAYCA